MNCLPGVCGRGARREQDNGKKKAGERRRVRTGENWFLCEKAYYCMYPFSAAVSCDLHAGGISVCERKRSFEYIIDWLPYLFFGAAILLAAFGICVLCGIKNCVSYVEL